MRKKYIIFSVVMGFIMLVAVSYCVSEYTKDLSANPGKAFKIARSLGLYPVLVLENGKSKLIFTPVKPDTVRALENKAARQADSNDGTMNASSNHKEKFYTVKDGKTVLGKTDGENDTMTGNIKVVLTESDPPFNFNNSSPVEFTFNGVTVQRTMADAYDGDGPHYKGKADPGDAGIAEFKEYYFGIDSPVYYTDPKDTTKLTKGPDLKFKIRWTTTTLACTGTTKPPRNSDFFTATTDNPEDLANGAISIPLDFSLKVGDNTYATSDTATADGKKTQKEDSKYGNEKYDWNLKAKKLGLNKVP